LNGDRQGRTQKFSGTSIWAPKVSAGGDHKSALAAESWESPMFLSADARDVDGSPIATIPSAPTG
jgi:hypothetical protein